MEVRYDLPDFRRRMLAAELRSGNQIFAHLQSADDDGVETNLSDEARRDIDSMRVVAGNRNSDEFALSQEVPYDFGATNQLLDEVDLPFNTSSMRNVYSPDVSTARELVTDKLAAALKKDPYTFRRELAKDDRTRAVTRAMELGLLR